MLSNAERAVADYLKKGMANKEIADKLCVCEKTVKYHLTNIYAKSGVKSRMEFVMKDKENFVPQTEFQEFEEIYTPPKINGELMLETGSRPIEPERITTIQEARATQRPLDQGARQVQVVKKSQEDKITFIDDKFKVGETITQLHSMMKDVTAKELTPATVNAACNCVARLNETINTAIQAARFLNEI
jgi:DNA-binding CsgD family transcriptional regulator